MARRAPRRRRGVGRRSGARSRLALFVASFVFTACGDAGSSQATRARSGPAPALADSTFVRLVAELSEPGGYFDTDNLISNERSYLHVLGPLRDLGVRGGAYVGVGPDQNFAYMAVVRPRIAFVVDIRRDNLLQHLLFKALFARAPTRIEYLSLLHGRPPPHDPEAWYDRSLEELVDRIDAARPDSASIRRARALVDSTVGTFGVPLSEEDRATIRRFHDTFVARGLSLRFSSHDRAPRPYYPTFRQLLLETDLEGRRGSYLARRGDYVYLREMQARNLVIPVVGDLAGSHALRAVAREIRGRGEVVSVFYTSNVEFYLFRQGRFRDFAANVRELPVDGRSVVVRSYFSNFRRPHPHHVEGYASTQTLQTLGSFREKVEGEGYRSYWELATRDAVDPR